MNDEPDALAIELRQASERRAEYERRAAELADAGERLQRARNTALRWRREAGRTAERIEQLSTWNPLRLLWRAMRGDPRGSLIEKLDHARRQHDEVDAEVERLQQQHDSVRQRVDEVADAPASYAQWIQRKEELLRERDGDTAVKLDASAAKIGDLAAQLESLRSMVAHGRSAEGELLSAKAVLQRARTVGLRNMMSPSALFASGQQGQYTAAKAHAERAERHLRNLAAAGHALSGSANAIEVALSNRVAGLSSGIAPVKWAMHGKMRVARDEISNVLENTRETLWSAEQRIREVAALLRAARDERDRWIEEAS